MDRIGSDYLKLGTHLLNDEDGGTMKTIEHDYKTTEEKLNEIFRRWIRGQRQTNTWEMLVKSLKYAKLTTLADKIEAVLQFCAEKKNDEEREYDYGEHMREAIMETKSFQYLISMLAVVIVGAAVFCCKCKLINNLFTSSKIGKLMGLGTRGNNACIKDPTLSVHVYITIILEIFTALNVLLHSDVEIEV